VPNLLKRKSHVHLLVCAEHKRDGIPDKTTSAVLAKRIQIHRTWEEDSQTDCGWRDPEMAS